MINRIQSLFLLAGALAVGGLLLAGNSLWPARAESASGGWFPVTAQILGGLVALAAVVSIFSARNPENPHRVMPGLQRQRKVVVLVQVLCVTFLMVLFLGLYLQQALPLVEDYGRLALLSLPVVAYGLFFMARRRIDRDIEEIRKADSFRLRD